tara:strand:+ start:1847 stop:2068 length:222 start_codon:yes stop_codon:yes gene_type:complete
MDASNAILIAAHVARLNAVARCRSAEETASTYASQRWKYTDYAVNKAHEELEAANAAEETAREAFLVALHAAY